jgi:hypothetical protein
MSTQLPYGFAKTSSGSIPLGGASNTAVTDGQNDSELKTNRTHPSIRGVFNPCRLELPDDNPNCERVIQMATKRVNRNRVADMVARARQLFNEGLLSPKDVEAILRIAARAANKLK